MLMAMNQKVTASFCVLSFIAFRGSAGSSNWVKWREKLAVGREQAAQPYLEYNGFALE